MECSQEKRSRPNLSTDKRWSSHRYRRSLATYITLLIGLVFLGYCLHFLHIPFERFFTMFGPLGDMLFHRYLPPDMAYLLNMDYIEMVVETLQMAVLGSVFGTLLSAPIAWFASFNMTPNALILYPVARFIIVAARAVHEIIWVILLVSLVGFGPFAGTLAIVLISVGFAGKLFAEEIEAIDTGQVEAVKATGANPFQVMLYGVLPQVRAAWVGIAIYNWDSNFRAATVLGFFGAGGMGWFLKRSTETLEYGETAAILLSIIALVVLSEIVSSWARQKMR